MSLRHNFRATIFPATPAAPCNSAAGAARVGRPVARARAHADMFYLRVRGRIGVFCNIDIDKMTASYVKEAELLTFSIYNPTLGQKEGTVRTYTR